MSVFPRNTNVLLGFLRLMATADLRVRLCCLFVYLFILIYIDV
jgi:hypothetical protein